MTVYLVERVFNRGTSLVHRNPPRPSLGPGMALGVTERALGEPGDDAGRSDAALAFGLGGHA